MTVDDVVKRLAGAVEKAGSQIRFAKANQLSPAYTNDVLRGRKEPGQGILKALGLKKVVTYVTDKEAK